MGKKRIKLSEIANCTGGRLIGDPDAEVTHIASLNNADETSLSFVVPAKGFLEFSTQPGVLLVSEPYAEKYAGNRIVVSDPYLAYAKISKLFIVQNDNSQPMIHATAVIDPSATIGSGVCIGAYVCIGFNCTVGDNTHIDASVTIYPNSEIGSGCNIASGVVIGASGFGYAPNQGKWQKIYQLGGVQIGNNVDVGANTTIDRGAIDNTTIGNGVKLDNQIQIAHNVQVGDDTIMAGCVAIAGSSVIGKRCQIGGRVSILGHLNIADDVILNAGAFVAKSIESAGIYASMIPAQPAKQWAKVVGQINRLDKLVTKLKKATRKA